jgi:hypothetical protein
LERIDKMKNPIDYTRQYATREEFIAEVKTALKSLTQTELEHFALKAMLVPNAYDGIFILMKLGCGSFTGGLAEQWTESYWGKENLIAEILQQKPADPKETP